MDDAPEFIRLKRRRHEESVDTLLIDDDKRVKRGKFMFKLTRTIEEQLFENNQKKPTPLLKLSDDDHRHFVLEQGRKRRRESNEDRHSKARDKTRYTSNEASDERDIGLPLEISNMLQEHLKLNEVGYSSSDGKKRKPSRKHFTGQAAKVVTMPSLDYVYDIYHLEKITDEDISSFDTQNIGFLRIIDRDLELVPDEEIDSSNALSDDQDSNEEDYYQNDYPEDEDDDRSILFGSEGEEVAADETEDIIRSIYNSDQKSLSAGNPSQLEDQKEYAELFNQLGSSSNILNSLNAMNFVDLDDPEKDADALAYEKFQDNYENEEGDEAFDSDENYEPLLKRNMFFHTDIEDPLAIHRDKIFGRLQRMIDKS